MLRRGSIGLVLRLRGKRDGKTASDKDQTELSATEHGGDFTTRPYDRCRSKSFLHSHFHAFEFG